MVRAARPKKSVSPRELLRLAAHVGVSPNTARSFLRGDRRTTPVIAEALRRGLKELGLGASLAVRAAS